MQFENALLPNANGACFEIILTSTHHPNNYFQVFAWGDNDHGQQGNATTAVNRKPAFVHGIEVNLSRHVL